MDKSEQLKKRISKSLHDQLDQEELRRLVDWLEADPQHLIQFNEVKERLEREQSRQALETGETERIFRLFMKRATQSQSKTRALLPRMSRVAAAALILTSMGLAAWFLMTDPKPEEAVITRITEQPYILGEDGEKHMLDQTEATLQYSDLVQLAQSDQGSGQDPDPEQMQDLVVPNGCRVKVELADGSVVHLNSASRLSYPVSFNGNERRVHLRGEAYFSVSHRDDQPFVVETEGLSVKVLGTTFNLSAFPNDEKITTTLVEGQVEIHPDTETGPVILHPNENGVFHKEQKILAVHPVDVSLYTSWTNGYYTFRSESLDQVIKKLNRSYGIPIRISGESIHDLRFSGKLDIKEEITGVLDIIKMVAPIDYYIRDHQIIIQKTAE